MFLFFAVFKDFIALFHYLHTLYCAIAYIIELAVRLAKRHGNSLININI